MILSGKRYGQYQDTKDQLARQYQTSIEDIRLFKNEPWRITSACYVVLGAMIGFSEKLGDFRRLTYSLIVIIVIAGIAGVYSADRALSRARDVIKEIREKYTPEAKDTISREYIKKNPLVDRIIFPWIFYVAIFVAAVVTGLVICNSSKICAS